MIRHFTSTGLVLHEDTILLIEHVKLGWWMPPGGHIDPNEDPAQAVIREVHEETGLSCEIVSDEHFHYTSGTVNTIARPFTILIEDVPENDGTIHQHIDFIYLLPPHRPVRARPAGRRSLSCLAGSAPTRPTTCPHPKNYLH